VNRRRHTVSRRCGLAPRRACWLWPSGYGNGLDAVSDPGCTLNPPARSTTWRRPPCFSPEGAGLGHGTVRITGRPGPSASAADFFVRWNCAQLPGSRGGAPSPNATGRCASGHAYEGQATPPWRERSGGRFPGFSSNPDRFRFQVALARHWEAPLGPFEQSVQGEASSAPRRGGLLASARNDGGNDPGSIPIKR